jgi:hypothetical protein
MTSESKTSTGVGIAVIRAQDYSHYRTPLVPQGRLGMKTTAFPVSQKTDGPQRYLARPRR